MKKLILILALAFPLTGEGGLPVGSTGNQPYVGSGVTLQVLSGGGMDFNSGSTVDFTGATVTGLTTGGITGGTSGNIITASSATTLHDSGTALSSLAVATPNRLQSTLAATQSFLDQFTTSATIAYGATRTNEGGSGTSTHIATASNTGTITISDGELRIVNLIDGVVGLRGNQAYTIASNVGSAVIAKFHTASIHDAWAQIGWANSSGTINGNIYQAVSEIQISEYGDLGVRYFSGSSVSKAIYKPGILESNVTYAIACKLTSDGFELHIQGGEFEEHFRAAVGSNVWRCFFKYSGGALAGNLYPIISTRGGITGVIFDDFQVVSTFDPFPDSQMVDYDQTKLALHVPCLLRISTGQLLASWENGTSDSNIDTKINMVVRDPAGNWGSLQTVVSAPGGGSSIQNGSLSLINGAIWLIYNKSPDNFASTSVIKYRVLTVSSTGTITAGSEQTISVSGTNMLANNPSITLSSGRILLPVYDDAIASLALARSDDNGTTWTKSNALTGDGMSETAVVLEPGTPSTIRLLGRNSPVIRTSTSTDSGVTISAASNTSIPCPDSRLMARNLPDGSILAAGNNTSVGRYQPAAYILGAGASIQRTMPIFDFGATSTSPVVQYPDVIMEGDHLIGIYSWKPSSGSGIQVYDINLNLPPYATTETPGLLSLPDKRRIDNALLAGDLAEFAEDPGTNASFDAAAWQSQLSVVIGANVQAYDAGLLALAGGSDFVQFTGPLTSTKIFTLPNASSTLLYAGGALGTPSGGTVTNLTGTASININGTVGATTPATGAFTSETFTLSNKSTTALATPSALSATQFTGFASTVSGAAIMGFGTTNDVSLMNRAGTVCLGIGPNTTVVNIPGSLTIATPLAVAQGGTGASSASITAFNNITGLSAAGTTGTTSTNLVFSTSPTFITPVLGAATATSVDSGSGNFTTIGAFIAYGAGTSIHLQANSGGLALRKDATIKFNDTVVGGGGSIFSNGSFDAALSRNGVNILEVNNGTAISGTSNAASIKALTFIPAGTATTCTGATIGSGSKSNAGFVTATTTGTSTIVITFPVTAPTGWNVYASDGTALTNLVQTASSTTTATLSGTTASGDIIRYIAMAY